jgi:hypothetical protein
VRAAIAALALTAASCAPAPAPTLANTGPAERDPRAALIAAILERYLDDPGTVPDAGLLTAAGPIAIAAEIGDAGPTIPATALPRRGRPFALRSRRWLQAEADRRGARVPFIAFGRVDISGARAQVEVGVDVAVPAAAHAIKLCCCTETRPYELRDGRWRQALGVIVSSCS